MPPSANEGLANQSITIVFARGRGERVRELNSEVVRVHEGAHSRRDCAAVKHELEILLRADPLARLALRDAVRGEPLVNTLGGRRVDPGLAVDVERGDA